MSLKCLLVLAGLAALAVLAYAPALSLPFIADDYGNLLLARQFGPVASWGALAVDPVHRYRPIYLVLTWWIWSVFGIQPAVFYGTSLVLHVLCTWLVFAVGAWRPIGWRLAGVSAAFFAVYEGHQEAVMWYSAAYEPLMLLFGLTSFVFWILWLDPSRGRMWHYAVSLLCFGLALFSKESAVILAPLLLLPAIEATVRSRRMVIGWLPFAGAAVLFAWSVFAGSGHHPRLDDGSFSWRVPAALTWLNSYWRLFWFWGLLGLFFLGVWRARAWWRIAAAGCVWAGLALVPYSFLVYMNRVPSRHTYLASVGLSWAVGAAVMAMRDRFRISRPWVVPVMALLIVVHNVGYLWTRKRAQYVERAAPTEALIAATRRTRGPIIVRRFPFPLIVAQGAVILGAGKTLDSLIWTPAGGKSTGLDDYEFVASEATISP